jgi:SAM-dependent methyltransferase
MLKRVASLLAQLKPRHLVGRLSGKYYFEDFVRVYPDGSRRDRSGKPHPESDRDRRNFLNHRKFYLFSAQFVKGLRVADIGCGSGYGCAMLKAAGAVEVSGADISAPAIAFARATYPSDAQFTRQGITDLSLYASGPSPARSSSTSRSTARRTSPCPSCAGSPGPGASSSSPRPTRRC